MTAPTPRSLETLTAARLAGMRRGIEKESLRALPSGKLALTPHPTGLGSALTHPSITTDYSESQLELITGVHTSVEACLAELTEIHRFVYTVLAREGEEMLWVASMPCQLPNEEAIPLGYYGTSNIGRAKSVYRMGLGHRYGRRMQTICGIHYNWSLPGLDNADYFALIRNFRRHAPVLLYLFGASPAVCPSFVEGRPHNLISLPGGAMYLPWATSLRMGRLGYQSEAQASLAVSYDSLEQYADSLHEALTVPYPAYEAIGIRNLGGEYNQLSTTLLQIENEFYSTIRPKRTIRPGERPLHALRERGVEYVEVRLMDLNPFETVGIDAPTMRFLDLFLLHCHLTPSPPDTPEEIVAMALNQRRTAAHGREPGFTLMRDGVEVSLVDWAAELVTQLEPIAARLDELRARPSADYQAALAMARDRLARPETLPSARVLAEMATHHDNGYLAFVRARSLAARQALLAAPLDSASLARYEAVAEQSLTAQRALEAAEQEPFETFRKHYVSAERLRPARATEQVIA
ncbi:MAG: glutamate--cysteine ligase [Casimicrobiaceae bacterium]